ncbi:MAG: hypothetical protein IJP37_03670 [Clostridia bacterium]|nr:hypothetical protein [Clostridia bacterium]
MAKAILFIHGFLGRKEQFSALANSARGLGHAAEFITLPGMAAMPQHSAPPPKRIGKMP